MKRLFQVILAVAMVVSYLPLAEAGDSATLGLTVSFAQPLKIWVEPEGPFKVKETHELRFKVIAEDPDTNQDVVLEAINLPEGAVFLVMGVIPHEPYSGPGPVYRAEGSFIWTPTLEQAREEPYIVEFVASNGAEEVAVKVGITVVEAVIAIELSPAVWHLAGVKLGDRIKNVDDMGNVIHSIFNAGDVLVGVTMRYGPMPATDVLPRIHPGLEQGVDIFNTIVTTQSGDEVLPPNDEIFVGSIPSSVDGAEKALMLPIVYGAPTGLSEPAAGMEAYYELRAHGIIPVPVGE